MKYIQTEAPIPIEQIKEYFKDKETFFIIDYEKSKIKNKVLLIYLANLDIPCDIKMSDNVTKEEKFQLLKDYFENKSVSDVPLLNVVASEVLLRFTGIANESLFRTNYFTNDEFNEFTSANVQTIIKWVHFMDSTMVFLIKIFEDLNEQIKVEENFPVIDDPQYVGLNVINLLNLPGFLEIYFSSPRSLSLSYFKQQFEMSMFKGKSLHQTYATENNMFIPLLQGLIKKELPINSQEILGA
jgi:ssDNA-specific exonuclease RecJ